MAECPHLSPRPPREPLHRAITRCGIFPRAERTPAERHAEVLRIDHPLQDAKPAGEVFEAGKAVGGESSAQMVAVAESHRAGKGIGVPYSFPSSDECLHDPAAGN